MPRPSDPLRASGSGPAPGAGPTPSTGPTPGTGPTGTGPAGTPGTGAATSPAWEAEARDLAGQVLRHLGAMHHGRSQDIQASTRGEAAVLFFLAQRSDDLPPPPAAPAPHGPQEPETFLTPGDLAAALSLSSARVANILKSLERKGQVERIHDTVDRRRVLVRLTPAGQTEVRRRGEEVLTSTTCLLTALGPEDGRAAVRILGRVRELMDSGVVTPPPPPHT
ncbi:MarR family winged helix-turn-helix transcriptional regulator [Actinomyces sp. HMT897]|uniref:MarR family winged helix-turn-helix transcriptional regulator n=1 Tax=Actinomyces sp. HMT897 TaxID=2789424 RepID=UPI00190D8BC5|nr:MarR family winged helix-turn-helix transcriptional regulator [Actinomyces sp. HMT897]QQO77844.1 winged helix-turn-helix transcriptional regulator [Actinomyces sp. HMT897]